MAIKLGSYEDQAKLSVVLAAIGGACAIAAAAFVQRNLDASTLWVRYDPKSLYMPALGGALLASLGAGTIGFFVALHSAGQRRNKKSRLSWAGFFLNAVVITLALCVGVFFFFTRFAMDVTE